MKRKLWKLLEWQKNRLLGKYGCTSKNLMENWIFLTGQWKYFTFLKWTIPNRKTGYSSTLPLTTEILLFTEIKESMRLYRPIFGKAPKMPLSHNLKQAIINKAL